MARKKQRASGAARRKWPKVPRRRLNEMTPQERARLREMKGSVWARLGLLRSVGRPISRSPRYLVQLVRDLAWIGEPNMPDAELAKYLLKNSGSPDAYHGIDMHTLQRDIGIAQSRIWKKRRPRGKKSKRRPVAIFKV